ncbi:MAG: hypothetical protein MZV49_11575 [Rhodopseudomonas palustris]|nr:hypothetical protein [Rhodopseudomonas palustris]
MSALLAPTIGGLIDQPRRQCRDGRLGRLPGRAGLASLAVAEQRLELS